MRFKLERLLAGLIPVCSLLSGCGEQSVAPLSVLPVLGAAIDGSEDAIPSAEPSESPGSELLAGQSAESDSAQDEPDTRPLAAAAQPGTASKTVEADPPAGPLRITYHDLTLIDFDVDAMLDAMLFPEEHKDKEVVELDFPAHLKALDGKQISIVGYMIPGEMEQGNVRDFMLVRDLAGCCFGGTPMPDEWIDVVMDEGAKAEYRPYLPMRVTGILTLGGEQDEAGFALGVYRLKGSQVTVEE